MIPVAEQVHDGITQDVELGTSYAASTWWHAFALAVLRAVPAIAAIGATTAATGYGFARSAMTTEDEGTYVAQAWSITHLGQLAPYTYWYDHPPLGWISLGILQVLIDPFTEFGTALEAGRATMLPVTLATTWLVYVVARRAGVARGFAATSVALFGLSPLAIQFHRMVLLDNIAVLWTLAAMALALTPSRRLWATAASGPCLAAAALSKETFVVMVPAIALLAWRNCDPRTRRFACTLAASLFCFCIAFYPLLAALKSELVAGTGHVSLEGALRWQLFDRTSSGSILDSNSEASATVRQWLTTDRWLLAAAFVSLPIAALVRRLQPFAIAFGSLVLIPMKPGYLPMMFVIAILPFAALMVGGALDVVWRTSGDRIRDRRLRALPARASSPIAVSIALAAAATMMAPAWSNGFRAESTVDHNVGYREAIGYISHTLPRDSKILVDDNLWLDLVKAGFHRDGIVWMYKLDRDPAVACRYPNRWRDFDYLVISPVMRTLAFTLPSIVEGMRHSSTVATFGRGGDRYTVARIHHGNDSLARTPLRGCPAIP